MCYYYVRHTIRDIFVQFFLYYNYFIGQVFSTVYMPKYQQPGGHYRKYTTSTIKLSKCLLVNRYHIYGFWDKFHWKGPKSANIQNLNVSFFIQFQYSLCKMLMNYVWVSKENYPFYLKGAQIPKISHIWKLCRFVFLI
jgi:hypothetical protein